MTVKCSVGNNNFDIQCDIDNGNPKHSASINDIELRLCFDSRKNQCPYAVCIDINTKYLNVNQCFCAYRLKNDIRNTNDCIR